MGINYVGGNFEGLNIAPSVNRTLGSTAKKDDRMENFTTVEWKNKNDGKTYVAKKITLKQGKEEVTGVFVFDKSAKPDEKGDINGEFMSFDSFMKKITSEVPSVNSSLAQSYFPNIVSRKQEVDESAILEGFDSSSMLEPDDESYPLELGLDFEEQFNSALKLSDGSMILKPQIEGAVSKLVKDENGNYYLKSRPVILGASETTRKITEEEILMDKGLCAGTIKKLDNNQYEVTYYTSDLYNNHEQETVVMDVYDCAKFISDRNLSSY